MDMGWVVGAQLSSSTSVTERTSIDEAFAAIAKVAVAVDLGILIVGAKEVPALFEALTDRSKRPVPEVYLWYNLLSDVSGTSSDDLVINWRGQQSHGWGGWAEQNADVEETFRFICPNNPDARRTTLTRLGELLDRYPFDGVFLDKIRLPSPANGADEMLSCFCPHCRRAAAAVGLDLDAVIDLFDSGDFSGEIAMGDRAAGHLWTDKLLAQDSIIGRALRFRCDSITSIVAEAAEEIRKRGRKVALDLYSPSIAPLVGQDYSALVGYADWAKPMTYRLAQGPASLRLEVPALVDNLSALTGTDAKTLEQWCGDHLPGFDGATLETIRKTAVPFPIISREIAGAVESLAPVPVYFGLELVHYPGVIEIAPSDVIGMVKAGRRAGAAGTIISWDLMHAPADGLRALGEVL
jgi:hypothetical protein